MKQKLKEKKGNKMRVNDKISQVANNTYLMML